MRLFQPSAARGFTVIEIMIAVFIMSVGFVSLYSLQIVAVDGNVVAQEFTQATQLAERWVETLRKDSVSWTNNANRPARLRAENQWNDAIGPFLVNKDLLDPDSYSPSQALDPRFCLKFRIQGLPVGDPDPRMLRADVRVIWPRKDVNLNPDPRYPEVPNFQVCDPRVMEGPALRSTWQVSLTSTLFRHSS